MVERPYITRFEVWDFACIRHCDLELTRLHALIGPNDSGKSTLLRALADAQTWAIKDGPLGGEGSERRFRLHWSDGKSLMRWNDVDDRRGVGQWMDGPLEVYAGVPSSVPQQLVGERIGSPRMLRLDPDQMRTAHSLIPSSQGIEFANERGLGLPAVYDALLARKRKAVDEIERQLRDLFPQADALILDSVSTSLKELAIQLKNSERTVHGNELSEGLLYFLAFAALPYLKTTPLVLVEEPENGLHPARVRDVIAVLRAVSPNMQVVIATHSPLVINELDGSEVSIVTRDDGGTHVIRLSKTANYEQRASVYKNGELWLGYGDGDQESELRNGHPAT